MQHWYPICGWPVLPCSTQKSASSTCRYGLNLSYPIVHSDRAVLLLSQSRIVNAVLFTDKSALNSIIIGIDVQHRHDTFAGAAMALSSTSVVLSSLWLRRYRRPRSVQRMDDQFTTAIDATSHVTSDVTLTNSFVNKGTFDPECTCLCCLQESDFQARFQLPNAKDITLPAIDGCPLSSCCSRNKDHTSDSFKHESEQENNTTPLMSAKMEEVVMKSKLNRTCECACSNCRCALLQARRRAG
jgi:hypothetical protein